MKLRLTKKYLLMPVLLAVMLLPACGFQLRGDYQLAERLGKTSLQLTDEYSDFSRKLERSLERAGVVLVNSEDADSIILVSKSAFTREVLSIGNDARVREFRLRLELEFSVLKGAQGQDQDQDQGQQVVDESQIRLKTQQLSQQRDLRFDAGRVLATSREAEFLQEDMSTTLVRQFMQRLGQLDPLEKLN